MEKPVPRWQKAVALVWLAFGVLLLSLWATRIWNDLWPLDRSPVGPNLVASYILFSVATIAAALLYPPFRRAIHLFVDGKLHEIHGHLKKAAEDRQELHRKLDHIVKHHPDIPALPRKRTTK